MKSEIQELINLIQKSLNLFSERKNLKDLKSRLAELEAISNNPDFWKNSNKAKVIMKEKQSIEKNISTYQNLKQNLNDNIEIYKLAIDENDFDIQSEIENNFLVTRYHSLTIDPDSLPNEIIVNAKSEDGVIMGIQHRELNISGVQFHPESIKTENGKKILWNFLNSK